MGANIKPKWTLEVTQEKDGVDHDGHHTTRQKDNTWMCQQTGVTDINTTIKTSKHKWAGHVARRHDNRWTTRTTEWTPREQKRPRGRPRTRWRDDLIHHMSLTWQRIAQDRYRWLKSREGFLTWVILALSDWLIDSDVLSEEHLPRERLQSIL